jgi:hypothetical protein
MTLTNGQVLPARSARLDRGTDAVAYAGRRITFVLIGVRE